MDYTTDIKVLLKTGNEEIIWFFNDESVTINKASNLWIKNNSGGVSEFFETVKNWYDLDKENKRTSYYILETSEMTVVRKTATYKVKKINEESQSIMFEEC